MFYARLRFIDRKKWADSNYEAPEVISPIYKTLEERNRWIQDMIQKNLRRGITVRKFLYPAKNSKEEKKNYEYDLDRIMMG